MWPGAWRCTGDQADGLEMNFGSRITGLASGLDVEVKAREASSTFPNIWGEPQREESCRLLNRSGLGVKSSGRRCAFPLDKQSVRSLEAIQSEVSGGQSDKQAWRLETRFGGGDISFRAVSM